MFLFVRADPTGSKAFFIVVGAALVGLGVSQWRHPPTLQDSVPRLQRPRGRESDADGAARVRRLAAAFTVGVGLVTMVLMGVALLNGD